MGTTGHPRRTGRPARRRPPRSAGPAPSGAGRLRCHPANLRCHRSDGSLANLAQLYIDGKASPRWIVDKVSEILTRSGYPNSVIDLPLGQLYGLEDEWGAGWGRTDAELIAVTRQACLDQLRLAAAR